MSARGIPVLWRAVLAASRFFNELVLAVDRLDVLDYSDAESELNLFLYVHPRGGGAAERLAVAQEQWRRSVQQAIGQDFGDGWDRGLPRSGGEWEAPLAAEYAGEDRRWWVGGVPLAGGGADGALVGRLRGALGECGHLAGYVLDHAGVGRVVGLRTGDPVAELMELVPGGVGRWYVETPLAGRVPEFEVVGCGSDRLATFAVPGPAGELESFLRSSRPEVIAAESDALGPGRIREGWADRGYALVLVEPVEGPVVDLINPLFGLNDGTLRIAAVATLDDHPTLWTRLPDHHGDAGITRNEGVIRLTGRGSLGAGTPKPPQSPTAQPRAEGHEPVVQLPYATVLGVQRTLAELAAAFEDVVETGVPEGGRMRRFARYLRFLGGAGLVRAGWARCVLDACIEDELGVDGLERWVGGIQEWTRSPRDIMLLEYAGEDRRWWVGGVPLAGGGADGALVGRLRGALGECGHLAGYVLDHAGVGRVVGLRTGDPVAELMELVPGGVGRWYVETPLAGRVPEFEVVGCGSDRLATFAVPGPAGELESFLRSSRPEVIAAESDALGPGRIREGWADRGYALVLVEPVEGPVVDLINPLFGLSDGTLRIAAVATLDDRPTLWIGAT
ncbi:hypothetical protein [Parenemella sanctibonifatiensis]|uniref:Uncharacterized protein n=1 Tax=Parenemella sanctibonifatiensis TaxID=2016505 RepID=A0A255ECS2_9ACTN|nr:hypothetical protein [Parenemella sanctibonifatiensis]OYN89347.1 hypothetical protein CGZ91_10610 [Parenemella sanctibonifatiensis]